jgi:hypothetical protein
MTIQERLFFSDLDFFFGGNSSVEVHETAAYSQASGGIIIAQ